MFKETFIYFFLPVEKIEEKENQLRCNNRKDFCIAH